MWKNDLKLSQQKEKELTELFIKANWIATTTQDKGNFPDYDIKVQYKSTSTPSYIELKHDRLSSKTKNVAVELYKTVSGQQQPSGLSITKADWIVYSFPDKPNFYGIDKGILEKLVAEKKYKKLVTGGDGNRVTLALFDRQVFLNHCEILNYETLV